MDQCLTVGGRVGHRLFLYYLCLTIFPPKLFQNAIFTVKISQPLYEISQVPFFFSDAIIPIIFLVNYYISLMNAEF